MRLSIKMHPKKTARLSTTLCRKNSRGSLTQVCPDMIIYSRIWTRTFFNDILVRQMKTSGCTYSPQCHNAVKAFAPLR